MKPLDIRRPKLGLPTTEGPTGAKPKAKPSAPQGAVAPELPSAKNSANDRDAASTTLGAALALAQDRSARDLVSVRTQGNGPGLGRGEVVEGRLRRSFEHGRPVARVDTRDGREISLSPRDVEGVADGGRVTLVADGDRLALDAHGTDAVASFLGTVERDGRNLVAVSRDPKSPFSRLKLHSRDASLVGKTVLAHVEDGLTRRRSGRVEEIIPPEQAWKTTFSQIALAHGVEATMGPEVEADIQRLRDVFNPEDIGGYTDLTDKPFFSIDNPYSKDFDQAMAIEPNPNKEGALDVYYAIADLDYFLDLAGEDSALAQRARRVQTTTYLPGFDFPVLPRDLSEDLCSLNEGEKRPAFIIKFTVDDKGGVSGRELIDGVIQNRRNGNYPEAQAHLEGKKVSDPVYAEGIDRLQMVGQRLLKGAEKRGMVTGAAGEKWATLDPKTGALKTEKRGQLWIEEANAQISITANQQMGEHLIGAGAPAFHRVHEDPEARRVQRARTMVRKLGVKWADGENARQVLERVDTQTALGRAVRRVLLRAMPRAHVSAMPGAHHGLKLSEYVQSTAPMRRTRDGQNHAWARDVRDGRKPDDAHLHELVENSQVAEDRSRKVDREVRTRLSAHALSEHVGKKLSAEVIGVSMFGVDLHFPKLDVEHHVPFRDLGGGPWDVVDSGLSARSKDRQRKLTLGATVEAKVASADAHVGVVKVEVGAIQKASAVKPAQTKAGVRALAEVRGDGFESPLVGERVQTKGVVSGVNSIGFFIQPAGTQGADAGGLLVRSKKKDIRPGDLVTVTGKVFERRNAGSPEERSIVELVQAKVKVTGHDEGALPPPSVIGTKDGGLIPADRKAAIDFWRERLGQRVEIGASTAVSASNPFGDLVVVPDDWTPERAVRTPEGGLVMPDGEWNHQSVGLKFRPHIGAKPEVAVGARLPKASGIVTFRSGSFQVELSELPEITAPPPRINPVTRLEGGPGQLTVAGVNALNMHPGAADRAELLGARIVDQLKSPDIVALQEIQDNDGPNQSNVVESDQTHEMLIDAIKAAGGPEYAWFDIPPVNGQDGGQPGGNIRNSYLYRPDRVKIGEGSIERIGEGNPAFDNSRKSLAAVFQFEGRELLVVNNHFSSRRGSSPWTSARDELVVGKAAERRAQAEAVKAHVDAHLEAHPERDALILGDFNDGNLSPTTEALLQGDFQDLTLEVPEDRRFDYNYRGTLGVLQPVVGSPMLKDRTEVEMLHEAVFDGVKSSDHDPVVVRLDMSREATDGSR